VVFIVFLATFNSKSLLEEEPFGGILFLYREPLCEQIELVAYPATKLRTQKNAI